MNENNIIPAGAIHYFGDANTDMRQPVNERFENLCSDANEATTMFRIVVKSNLTQSLAENLAQKIENIVTILDDMDGGYESIHSKLNDLAIGAKDNIPIEELREFSGSIGDLPTRSLNKSQFIQQSFRKKKQQRTSIIAQNICWTVPIIVCVQRYRWGRRCFSLGATYNRDNYKLNLHY